MSTSSQWAGPGRKRTRVPHDGRNAGREGCLAYHAGRADLQRQRPVTSPRASGPPVWTPLWSSGTSWSAPLSIGAARRGGARDRRAWRLPPRSDRVVRGGLRVGGVIHDVEGRELVLGHPPHPDVP